MVDNNNSYFKKSVLYYHDKLNNVFVYYDNFTKNYLGYSKDNKDFKTYKSDSFITVKYSIRDMLINLGLKNKFVNLFHLNKEFNSIKFDVNNINTNETTEQLLRDRISNLNFIINKSKAIIEKIKYNIKSSNEINEETKLINDLNKALRNFKTTNKENKKGIFKNINILTNNNNIEELPDNIKLNFNKNYFDSHILNELNNFDNKLIFYYLHNLKRLLDYNKESMIKTNISLMIMRIIIYCFNQYYIPLENTTIRKFDYILVSDTYIDDSMIASGYYQDLINTNEIDDKEKEEIKNKDTDIQEELNALDIDDYDDDDLHEDFDTNEDVVENLMNND